MSRPLLALAILVALPLGGGRDSDLNVWAAAPEERPAPTASEASGVTDPLGPNAGCYVCHMTLVREELSRTHLKAKVACVKCHGLSAGHANDEDIGATPPDRTYGRDRVNRMCRRCHKTHDVPPEVVVARWVERELTQSPPVCTDCHGAHRIDRGEETGDT